MREEYTDPRRLEAMRTNQSNGRGWRFDAAVDQAPAWVRVLEVLFRPSSLFAGLLLGLSVFMLIRF